MYFKVIINITIILSSYFPVKFTCVIRFPANGDFPQDRAQITDLCALSVDISRNYCYPRINAVCTCGNFTLKTAVFWVFAVAKT